LLSSFYSIFVKYYLPLLIMFCTWTCNGNVRTCLYWVLWRDYSNSLQRQTYWKTKPKHPFSPWYGVCKGSWASNGTSLFPMRRVIASITSHLNNLSSASRPVWAHFTNGRQCWTSAAVSPEDRRRLPERPGSGGWSDFLTTSSFRIWEWLEKSLISLEWYGILGLPITLEIVRCK